MRSLTFNPDSSMITCVEYDFPNRNLYIRFVSTTVYVYRDVPEHVFEHLYAIHLSGGSVGKYVLGHVRGHYPCVPVSELAPVAPVLDFRKDRKDRIRAGSDTVTAPSLVVSSAYADKVKAIQQEQNKQVMSIYNFPKRKDPK